MREEEPVSLATRGANRAGVSLVSLLLAGVASLALSSPAEALVIDPIFDSSITSLPGGEAAAVEGTINSAIGLFESTYSNPITATIEFQSGGGLGESQVGFVYIQNYQSYYNALVATNANPAAIAGLTANGGNSPNNPVTGTSVIDVKSADLRAVGLPGAPLCNVTGASGSLTCSGTPGGPSAIDGIISLNTAITYPPQPNNGSNYGLMSTTEHEINEILGLGSALPGTNATSGTVSATTPTPEDLFRYTAGGTRSALSVNCASPGTAFFSYGGVTNLAQFNNACNGGDFADWQSSPLPSGVSAQVQDAFAEPGPQPSYGPNEIAAMSAIGYTTVPAPLIGFGFPTFLALGGLLFGAKLLQRRRRGIGLFDVA